MQIKKQIALVAAIVFLFSCSKKQPEKTILALGDSYTIGQSVAPDDRYIVQTVKVLHDKRIEFSDPEIIARSGWTTTDLMQAIQVSPPLRPAYDFVTLLIGTNNQFRKRSQEEYAKEFTILLEKAIAFAGNNKNHVIVLSMPDYSVTTFDRGHDTALIKKEIDAFNAANQKISKEKGVQYLDITESSRMAQNDVTLLANDGLHYSKKEYQKWAIKLADLIQKSL